MRGGEEEEGGCAAERRAHAAALRLLLLLLFCFSYCCCDRMSVHSLSCPFQARQAVARNEFSGPGGNCQSLEGREVKGTYKMRKSGGVLVCFCASCQRLMNEMETV